MRWKHYFNFIFMKSVRNFRSFTTLKIYQITLYMINLEKYQTKFKKIIYRKVRNKSRGLYFFAIFIAACIRGRLINEGVLYWADFKTTNKWPISDALTENSPPIINRFSKFLCLKISTLNFAELLFYTVFHLEHFFLP